MDADDKAAFGCNSLLFLSAVIRVTRGSTSFGSGQRPRQGVWVRGKAVEGISRLVLAARNAKLGHCISLRLEGLVGVRHLERPLAAVTFHAIQSATYAGGC